MRYSALQKTFLILNRKFCGFAEIAYLGLWESSEMPIRPENLITVIKKNCEILKLLLVYLL